MDGLILPDAITAAFREPSPTAKVDVENVTTSVSKWAENAEWWSPAIRSWQLKWERYFRNQLFPDTHTSSPSRGGGTKPRLSGLQLWHLIAWCRLVVLRSLPTIDKIVKVIQTNVAKADRVATLGDLAEPSEWPTPPEENDVKQKQEVMQLSSPLAWDLVRVGLGTKPFEVLERQLNIIESVHQKYRAELSTSLALVLIKVQLCERPEDEVIIWQDFVSNTRWRSNPLFLKLISVAFCNTLSNTELSEDPSLATMSPVLQMMVQGRSFLQFIHQRHDAASAMKLLEAPICHQLTLALRTGNVTSVLAAIKQLNASNDECASDSSIAQNKLQAYLQYAEFLATAKPQSDVYIHMSEYLKSLSFVVEGLMWAHTPPKLPAIIPGERDTFRTLTTGNSPIAVALRRFLSESDGMLVAANPSIGQDKMVPALLPYELVDMPMTMTTTTPFKMALPLYMDYGPLNQALRPDNEAKSLNLWPSVTELSLTMSGMQLLDVVDDLLSMPKWGGAEDDIRDVSGTVIDRCALPWERMPTSFINLKYRTCPADGMVLDPITNIVLLPSPLRERMIDFEAKLQTIGSMGTDDIWGPPKTLLRAELEAKDAMSQEMLHYESEVKHEIDDSPPFMIEKPKFMGLINSVVSTLLSKSESPKEGFLFASLKCYQSALTNLCALLSLPSIGGGTKLGSDLLRIQRIRTKKARSLASSVMKHNYQVCGVQSLTDLLLIWYHEAQLCHLESRVHCHLNPENKNIIQRNASVQEHDLRRWVYLNLARSVWKVLENDSTELFIDFLTSEVAERLSKEQLDIGKLENMSRDASMDEMDPYQSCFRVDTDPTVFSFVLLMIQKIAYSSDEGNAGAQSSKSFFHRPNLLTAFISKCIGALSNADGETSDTITHSARLLTLVLCLENGRDETLECLFGARGRSSLFETYGFEDTVASMREQPPSHYRVLYSEVVTFILFTPFGDLHSYQRSHVQGSNTPAPFKISTQRNEHLSSYLVTSRKTLQQITLQLISNNIGVSKCPSIGIFRVLRLFLRTNVSTKFETRITLHKAFAIIKQSLDVKPSTMNVPSRKTAKKVKKSVVFDALDELAFELRSKMDIFSIMTSKWTTNVLSDEFKKFRDETECAGSHYFGMKERVRVEDVDLELQMMRRAFNTDGVQGSITPPSSRLHSSSSTFEWWGTCKCNNRKTRYVPHTIPWPLLRPRVRTLQSEPSATSSSTISRICTIILRELDRVEWLNKYVASYAKCGSKLGSGDTDFCAACLLTPYMTGEAKYYLEPTAIPDGILAQRNDDLALLRSLSKSTGTHRQRLDDPIIDTLLQKLSPQILSTRGVALKASFSLADLPYGFSSVISALELVIIVNQLKLVDIVKSLLTLRESSIDRVIQKLEDPQNSDHEVLAPFSYTGILQEVSPVSNEGARAGANEGDYVGSTLEFGISADMARMRDDEWLKQRIESFSFGGKGLAERVVKRKAQVAGIGVTTAEEVEARHGWSKLTPRAKVLTLLKRRSLELSDRKEWYRNRSVDLQDKYVATHDMAIDTGCVANPVDRIEMIVIESDYFN